MNPHTDLDEFPVTVDQPDNSDLMSPTAATINTPTDGLLNRTFWLGNRLATLPALNWNPTATPGDDLDTVWINETEGRLYASKSGAADIIYFSRNFGESWVSDSRPAGALAIRDGYTDTDGNMILSSLASVQGYDYDEVAQTYTARNMLIGTPAGAQPLWSESASLWCIVFRDGASGIKARTSPDRTNFTTRTLPTAFSTYIGSENAQAGVNEAGDIVVFLNTGTGTDYKGAHSNDGGVTWTAFTIATTIDTSVSRPIYSEVDQIWMVIAYDVAGEECEVWTSTTGFGGWVKVYTGSVGAFALHHLSCSGRCFAALGDGGKLYYSIDRGVTWRKSGQAPLFASYADLSMAGLGGGFVVLDSNTPATKTSTRVGVEGVSV
jgi:hypothetical protein